MEVKDVPTMNSFELVNGLVKYAMLQGALPDTEPLRLQAQTNVKLVRAELLARLDTRPKEGEANQHIEVPVSESDLQDLQNGEEFNWTFTTDKGLSIDILLRPEVDEDNEA
jgi:hypothetical protein